MTREMLEKESVRVITLRTITARVALSKKAAAVEAILSKTGEGEGDNLTDLFSALLGESLRPTSSGYVAGHAFKINPECKDSYPAPTQKGSVYVALDANTAISRREGARTWSGLPKFTGTQHITATAEEIAAFVTEACEETLLQIIMAVNE